MKYGVLAISTYLAAVLQSAACFRLADDAPAMLFLPIVLMLALSVCEGWSAIVWAAVIGFLGDCLKSGPMGIDLLCAVLVAALSLHLQPERKRCGRVRRLFRGTVWCFAFVLTATALDVAVARQTVSAVPLLNFAAFQTGQCFVAAVVGLLGVNALSPLIPRRWRSRSVSVS